jgi:16S rRNA (adenine1518-N6/adenine1519-N6)-dimethyltransferase
MRPNKSCLSELFRIHNIHANSALGQNFLIDPNFLNYIVNSGGFRENDILLEIGSGPGILTNLLAPKVSKIWAVEIDHKLFAISKELFGHLNNVVFIRNNILNKKQDGLNPEVLSTIRADIEKPLRVISNLPYKTAVPIIMALLEGRLRLTAMLLMVQKEIAHRLIAVHSEDNYGAVSILCYYLARIKILRKVPPDVFWPKPMVYSTLISVIPDYRFPLPREQYFLFKSFLREVFAYSRKTIKQALLKTNRADKTQIEKILSLSRIEISRRPKQITPEEYLGLFHNLNPYPPSQWDKEFIIPLRRDRKTIPM